MTEDKQNPHAIALAKIGASKGGVARANLLTKEQRQEIARQAAMKRWNSLDAQSNVPQATYGRLDHPLLLGGSEVPCYVVVQKHDGEDDPLRLVVLGGMLKALNMAVGTAGRGPGNRLSRFVATQSLEPYVSEELKEKINSPILFKTPGGSLAYGYEETVLADICDVVLEARKDNRLNYQQAHIAHQCEILVRAWARVGLASLIDEATGYQYHRSRNALQRILDKFIIKELRAWTKTFEDDYYENLFRLRGWTYVPFKVQRPPLVGLLTNDIIYSRLAPGVLHELRRVTPKDSKGRRKIKFHQKLTEDHGHPKLREHLAGTVALMKASDTWTEFYRMLQRSYPQYNVTLQLPLPEDVVDAVDQPSDASLLEPA